MEKGSGISRDMSEAQRRDMMPKEWKGMQNWSEVMLQKMKGRHVQCIKRALVLETMHQDLLVLGMFHAWVHDEVAEMIDKKRKEWGLKSRGQVLEHLLGWMVEAQKADK